MFVKSLSQQKRFIFSALFVLCAMSNIVFASKPDDTDADLKWMRDLRKARPILSNIVVLGPSHNGKSTLVNLLMHTSEYATRAKEGAVLLDSSDRMKPIYHRDIFRLDVSRPVNPNNFRSVDLSEDFKEIPTIGSVVSVLGPIPVNDFLKERSVSTFDEEQESSGEKMSGGTIHPHLYRSHKKVRNPVFQTTIVDAPGIDVSERVPFFKRVIEKVPSDEINAFLLVVSAEQLAKDDFGPDTFAYFKGISALLELSDPTFARVLLAVTHAGNQDFLLNIPKGDNPRRFAAEKFRNATGMLVDASNIFFFENQYNCLSESAIESLYNCDSGKTVDPEIQTAFMHRQKNYQLNVLESFNLLKAIAANPPLSRYEILDADKLAGFSGSEKIPEPTEDLGCENGYRYFSCSAEGAKCREECKHYDRR